MIRRPPRSTPLYSSAASDVYKRQVESSAKENGTVETLNQAYNDMLDGGFAEKVPEGERHLTDGCHYLQCHPVFRLDKESTKCRIVMNASARTSGGCSLNDTLFQGPCLLPDVVHVLIRFRMNLVAYVLDISKMFLRIKLAKHKDFLRFLWRDCQSSVAPEVWRMISVTFGVISSPLSLIHISEPTRPY